MVVDIQTLAVSGNGVIGDFLSATFSLRPRSVILLFIYIKILRLYVMLDNKTNDDTINKMP